MDLNDGLAALAGLRVTRYRDARQMSVPLTLSWAIRRTAAGAPRLARWSAVREELARALASEVGLAVGSVSPEYAVLALRTSPLWELTAADPPPPARQAAVRDWLDRQNPELGLSEQAVEMLDIAVNRNRIAAAVGNLVDGITPDILLTPGMMFVSRREVQEAGLHRAGQAGIVGTAKTGAESIVVSGGYEDDRDYGDYLIYTGHGGRGENGRQVRDQSFDSPGNAALITSCLTGQPVRVIRKKYGSSGTRARGYEYSGLYRVEKYWHPLGLSGYRVCLYRLVALEPDSSSVAIRVDAPTVQPATPSGNPEPARRTSTTQRVVRSSAVVEHVKRLHGNHCQICGIRLDVGGRGYAEGAHIRPLGRPHDGSDTAENLLCLCPNCHVQFDNGAIYLEDDLTIRVNGASAGRLRVHDDHNIAPEFVTYHREQYA